MEISHVEKTQTRSEWSHGEDTKLLLLHNKFGNRWVDIANQMKGRTSKQVRNRFQTINPKRNRGDFTVEEDRIIYAFQAQLGNKWTKISKQLNGRTPNQVKNRWNGTLKKKK